LKNQSKQNKDTASSALASQLSKWMEQQGGDDGDG